MNGWSWSLGRIFGIDTRVHATFLLIVGWAAFSAIAQGGTLLAGLVSVLFLLAVFASVFLHELGHALTARRFGIRTRRITLSPLGGVAQLEGGMMPPKAELWVALAGPAVSFALAAIFFGLASLTGDWSPTTFVGSLAWANLMIAAFNMLPAFPMDGGRVFRAALSERLGYRRATEIAAKVGRVAGVAMMVLGVLTRPLLILIGGFVYLAAGAEARQARSFFGFGGGGNGGGGERRPRAEGNPGWYQRWRERVRLSKLSAEQGAVRGQARGSDRRPRAERAQRPGRAQAQPSYRRGPGAPHSGRVHRTAAPPVFRVRRFASRPQPQRRRVVILFDA